MKGFANVVGVDDGPFLSRGLNAAPERSAGQRASNGVDSLEAPPHPRFPARTNPPTSSAQGPFTADHRGDVVLCGTVYARERLDGVLFGRCRRDGRNATGAIARLVGESRFADHAQCVLLAGLTFGGFNVVDLPVLHAALGIPILVVMRRRPRFAAIQAALLGHVRGGEAKWARIERAGPVEPCAGLFVQRAGLSAGQAEATLGLHIRYGHLPECLRVAHLLAAARTRGHSHGAA